MSERIETEADNKILKCLEEKISFAMIAGAGSGKTTSLIDALRKIRSDFGSELRRNSQQVACITYTKRAVQVISSRLEYDELFSVSTLHSFLWGEIKTFTKDIRSALCESRIPSIIDKYSSDDNGGNSKKAIKARERIAELKENFKDLENVNYFSYEDGVYSEYKEGKLSHDDIVEIAGYLLNSKELFRKAIGFKYPYIFIDEAQDTFPVIVEAFNYVCKGQGLPMIGYFGDPWQQIYDQRADDFKPPEEGISIQKTENFRCSNSVISFLNVFRSDVEQYAAGKNKDISGSVKITIVETEAPGAPRKRYTEDQIERALERMDQAIKNWGWSEKEDYMKLFLARQMIARRIGFTRLQSLFTGPYASTKAQDDYETGEHFLLKPIIDSILPLLNAYRDDKQRLIIDILRSIGPAFDIHGINKDRSLKEMIDYSKEVVAELADIWCKGTIKDVFNYCYEKNLISFSDSLTYHLKREPRAIEYNDSEHSIEKADWLCDLFFLMDTDELQMYCDFISENTAYSTQHGVKGEEYNDVLVVFDDIEAAWNNYSFSKLLTPVTAGDPTEGQSRRSRKLAYVCFSRAQVNLRILLFSIKPDQASKELIDKGFITESDINHITI